MAVDKTILKNCRIEVNGVVLSTETNQVEVNMKAAEVDTTNFGGGGKQRQQGLRDDSFTVNFLQNFNPAMVHETLNPLFQSGSEFPVKVRPTTGAVSATNPEFQATCVMFTYVPLSGKPGDLSDTKIQFTAQGAGINVAITP